jgi:anti-anti-sigma regulatory factor
MSGSVTPDRPLPAPTAGARQADGGLWVEVRWSVQPPVLVVHGDLDQDGAALLDAVVEHVAPGTGQPVPVDLGAVDFADTHGIEPLLRRDVVVLAASPAVHRLLRLVGAPPVRGVQPRLRYRHRPRGRAVAGVCR